MNTHEKEIIKYAMRLRVKPSVLRVVCLKRKVSPKKAALIVASTLNKARESKFEF